ncbi:chemotaxis protein CheC [Halobacteriales archaeon QS_8_69_26]|nr:MAG: chemotaxis protein CheC [Halobacteriales archaeon QS_8_69_26]
MELDVNALGTFYRMASEGAGLAAGRLTHMTGVDTRVGVTRLNFVRGSEVAAEFDDGRAKVGVRVDTEDGLEGSSMVVFDRENALRIVSTLVPDSMGATDEFDELNTSAMTEVGQIMNSGFIDGWADVLETVIDLSPPEFVTGESAADFIGHLPTAPDEDDFVVLFRSNIEAVGTEVGFSHYFFPEHESISSLVERRREDDAAAIDYDKLEGFDRMAEQGAEEAADNITTLTGIETEIDIRRLNFVSLEAIAEEVADEMLVGIAFEFDGTPSGYLVLMFDEDSAEHIAEAMMPGAGDGDDGLSEMGQSALQELGNIMTSGMLDGWANVLDTTIDHSTPEFIHDAGSAAIDPIVINLGENQEYAFVFDTRIRAADADIDCDIFAIPDEEDLMRALDDLDVARVGEAPTTAEFPVDGDEDVETVDEPDPDPDEIESDL